MDKLKRYKILIITFLILNFNLSFSQITTTNVYSENKKEISVSETKLYDSTLNFLGTDVKKYIGQVFYLKGLNQNLRDGGYREFYLNTFNDAFSNSENIYKHSSEGNFSNYSDLSEKHFKVLDVINRPDPYNIGQYKDEFFIKLEELSSKEICYFKYTSKYKWDFPFIVVGYFEKCKVKFIGKDYVTRGKNWVDEGKMLDKKTGLPIKNFDNGDKWRCTDVTVENEYYELSLKLVNNKGEQIFISVDEVNNPLWILPYNLSELYKKKYGLENWKYIIRGSVKIGMSKEMCIASWGKPKDINKTVLKKVVSEQWVYDNNYLYFENGILRAIQK